MSAEIVRTAWGVAPVLVTIEPRYVSTEVAGRIFGGVGARTIVRRCTDEGMPHVRKGRRLLIPVAQATAWHDARLST